MECESKSGTSNNTENSTQFKIIQIIPDQHTRKARNQGTTKKKAILDTANILRKVLMYKYKTFNMEITLLVANIVNTE